MLVIRESQIKVFEAVAKRAFEDEMVTHLAVFSPPLFKAIGEKQMRQVVQFGIRQADRYGFTFRGPVRLYLELMLLFGSYFDTDPQYPWAAGILKNQDSGPQMQRAEQLYERTMDYRKKVAGPDDTYTLKALRNISILTQQPLVMVAENFAPTMRQEIACLYPQKAAYVGEAGIDALIRKGINGARRQRFSTVHGTALVVMLMLAFGHGCGADPLYPWIAQVLKDETITDHEVKAKRLEKEAITWIEYFLAYFNKSARA